MDDRVKVDLLLARTPKWLSALDQSGQVARLTPGQFGWLPHGTECERGKCMAPRRIVPVRGSVVVIAVPLGRTRGRRTCTGKSEGGGRSLPGGQSWSATLSVAASTRGEMAARWMHEAQSSTRVSEARPKSAGFPKYEAGSPLARAPRPGWWMAPPRGAVVANEQTKPLAAQYRARE